MRIRSLDHIVLTCADPEATVAFYELVGERESAGSIPARVFDLKTSLNYSRI
jgi:catechol 2,3-dioxygenase-like lactoylglutathione lyase family enzyme